MMPSPLSRKRWLSLPFAVWCCAVGAEPAVGLWQFAVHLDDTEVGHHEVRIVAQGDHLVATSRLAIQVKVLFFDAYRYEHEAREVWREGCLAAIESRTDDNGTTHAVSGVRQGDQFSIDAQQGRVMLPECPMSFAYWNPEMLHRAKLINAQTGDYIDVRVGYAGEERVAVDGNDVMARRYELSTADRRMAIWYDQDGRWLGLEAEVEGGRTLRYVPRNWPRMPEALARRNELGWHTGS